MVALGLIGARSGSKSVLDKNIKPILGKPLMAWIIEAAKASKRLDRVIVSTDSLEYAEIAKNFGAEVPFLRPKEFAQDTSLDLDYIKHALEWLERNESYRPDIVVRLVPTAPLQKPEDIDACIEELEKNPRAQSAVVVAEARQNPRKALKLKADAKEGPYLVSHVTGLGHETTVAGRQMYEKAYFRANVIASRIEVIKKLNMLTGDRVRYHVIPQERAIDIDSPLDFFVAEKLMERDFNML